MTKIAGSGSISQKHGSADPDPFQNVMDPGTRSQTINYEGKFDKLASMRQPNLA